MAFKKGQSGNPKGRPKVSPDIKSWRAANPGIDEIILELVSDPDNLDEQLINGKTAWHRLVARVILEGIEKGCERKMEALAQRVYGKVKDKIEVELPKPTIIERLDGSEFEMGAKLEDEDEDKDS